MWHFLYFIDALPWMIQYSLLLFGVGLTVSFWETNLYAVESIIATMGVGMILFLPAAVSRVGSKRCLYKEIASFLSISRISRIVRRMIVSRAASELRYVVWILRTSSNEADRMSTFKYLLSMSELRGFPPVLVEKCFCVFLGCIGLRNGRVVIRQGSEQLATMSARCFFRTFHHLSVTDPSSYVLKGLCRRYKSIFPPGTDFSRLPFQMTMIHSLIQKRLSPRPVKWDDDEISTQEWIPLAWYMARAAQVGYEEKEDRGVPHWIVRFALASLSLDPPASIIHCCRLPGDHRDRLGLRCFEHHNHGKKVC